jgi:SAM-dependent methyltransferase
MDPSHQIPDIDATARRVTGLYAGSSRFVRGFVNGKLRRDPATRAILNEAMASPFGDLVDLGCGRGQLGLAILTAGLASSLIGLDRDAAKIADATSASVGLSAKFAVAELGQAPIPECDTAMLIDILVQMPVPAQQSLLSQVASAARRQILIRAFDPDCGWRAQFGFNMERIGRIIRQDGAEIRPLPMAQIAGPLEAAGFSVSVRPCWAGTPLPNVLLIARRGDRAA